MMRLLIVFFIALSALIAILKDSVWKDFVFECDLVRKRRKALKADKTGILREIEDNRKNQLAREANNYNPLNGTANHNAASSIIVVSRKTIDRLMKDEGLDYRNYKVRQNIMSTAMCMMIGG